MEGSYTPDPTLDKYTKELLAELRIPKAVREKGQISMDLTVEEHKKGWRSQKERTASETDGLSFSHYIAACEDDTLAEVNSTLRIIPYVNGFSPEPWQMITDAMILKKAGVLDVELMHTIQLMHSEFNMNNKKMARDMMKAAESLKLIAREQYGSRKHHQAIMAALNKRLTMDLFRYRRQAGAICSNDAKS